MRRILIQLGFIRPKQIKTAADIKKIIEPIPESKFCVGRFENGEGQCCFLGHIGKHMSGSAHKIEGYRSTLKLTEKYLAEKHNIHQNVTRINDDRFVNGYNDETPKKRVIHLLDDMIKDGW